MKKVFFMIGMPNAGKSTLVKNCFQWADVVCRDDILMEYGRKKYGDLPYTEMFKKLTPEDQKEIDKLLYQKIEELQKEGKSFVIDMTLLSKKSRKRMLEKIHNDYKINYINVICGFDTILRRNQIRAEKTGKFIPEDVLRDMWQRYETPTKDEDKRIESIYFINTEGKTKEEKWH